MKLVEINDVRPGQVWKDDESYLVLIGTDLKGTWYNSKGVSCMGGMELCDTVHCKLTGFLGITHELKDNKLVEIKRNEVNEDDIVCFDEETSRLAVTLKVSPITITPTVFDGQKTELNRKVSVIGILGVTHEFVNDRGVQQ